MVKKSAKISEIRGIIGETGLLSSSGKRLEPYAGHRLPDIVMITLPAVIGGASLSPAIPRRSPALPPPGISLRKNGGHGV
jgi:hypothetical protein